VLVFLIFSGDWSKKTKKPPKIRLERGRNIRQLEVDRSTHAAPHCKATTSVLKKMEKVGNICRCTRFSWWAVLCDQGRYFSFHWSNPWLLGNTKPLWEMPYLTLKKRKMNNHYEHVFWTMGGMISAWKMPYLVWRESSFYINDDPRPFVLSLSVE
jgi:hypothetical protein